MSEKASHPILFPVGFSEASEAAAPYVRDLAEPSGAPSRYRDDHRQSREFGGRPDCDADTRFRAQPPLLTGSTTAKDYMTPVVNRGAASLVSVRTGDKFAMARRYCFLLILLGIIAPARQNQPAGIEGFVTSDLAARIPNATIGVDSLTRGFHRQTATNTSGYYLVNELNPGAYSVWADVNGLGCIIYPHVTVFPGQRVRQDFHFVRAKRYPGACEPLQKKPK
jgi:Carboxypeptidase regulatory-like domain